MLVLAQPKYLVIIAIMYFMWLNYATKVIFQVAPKASALLCVTAFVDQYNKIPAAISMSHYGIANLWHLYWIHWWLSRHKNLRLHITTHALLGPKKLYMWPDLWKPNTIANSSLIDNYNLLSQMICQQIFKSWPYKAAFAKVICTVSNKKIKLQVLTKMFVTFEWTVTHSCNLHHRVRHK